MCKCMYVCVCECVCVCACVCERASEDERVKSECGQLINYGMDTNISR